MATKTNLDIFKEFYPQLMEILPVDSLINHFFAKQLLSGDHKDKLRDRSINREKVKYFLDDVVERGLKIGYMEQFNEMLAVMANSDDPAVKFVANEMMKSRGNVPPTPILNDPTQGSQAIPQNTEPQSKCASMYLNLACYHDSIVSREAKKMQQPMSELSHSE